MFKAGAIRDYLSCYCIKFKKRLDEGLRLQLLAKNLEFLSGYIFKLIGKNLNEGVQAPWSSLIILVLITGVHVYGCT